MDAEVQTVVMTTYEKWALIMSAIALVLPAFIWLWKRYAICAKLNHYQTGIGYLFINQSGSYIRIQSVFEALNKAVSVKNISLTIKRESDNQQRFFIWSVFTSPVNMQFIGNNASSVEIAHPFRIEENNIYCAFLEYSDQHQKAYRQLTPYYTKLSQVALEMNKSNISYDDAIKVYVSSEEYRDASSSLEKELFWEIDKYTALLCVRYAKKEKIFEIKFDVNSEQYQILRQNMKESLLVPLKTVYNVRPEMLPVTVDVQG